MIPLWLTITCAIISLIVIFYILITSDIDWKYTIQTIQIFTAVAIAVITSISGAIVYQYVKDFHDEHAPFNKRFCRKSANSKDKKCFRAF